MGVEISKTDNSPRMSYSKFNEQLIIRGYGDIERATFERDVDKNIWKMMVPSGNISENGFSYYNGEEIVMCLVQS